MSATFLVTGANRGLGLAWVRTLREVGHDVVATAREPDRAEELRRLDVRVEALDAASDQSATALGRRLAGTPVDVLIHNAGVGGGQGGLAELDFEEMLRVFDVNALGALRVARALLPSLRAGRGRRIVNVTSRMGSIEDDASGGSYGYRASKAALNMLTHNLALELAPEGFVCIVLHPGWVRTDMGGTSAPLTPKESVEASLRVVEGLRPEQSGGFFDYTGARLPW